MIQPPPQRPVSWTFSTDSGSGPQMSGQRFDTISEAANAARDWLDVCAENAFFPAVSLGTVTKGE